MKKGFKYLGHHFEPIRNFIGREGNFKSISKRLNSIGINNRQGRWSWDKFFDAAAKHGVNKVDLYSMDGEKTVCPCENELFEYIKKGN